MSLFLATGEARPELETTLAALANRFGERFSAAFATREQHANTTTWIGAQPPDAVVWPETTEEVAEIVRLCAAARTPIIPFGAAPRLRAMSTRPSAASASRPNG